jgi:hypothetical protein
LEGCSLRETSLAEIRSGRRGTEQLTRRDSDQAAIQIKP